MHKKYSFLAYSPKKADRLGVATTPNEIVKFMIESANELCHYSAIEWILDQYKEKTPKDPTIREKFNNYHFADYKEQVIDLIKRVTTVSVETMKIVGEMEEDFIV